MNRVLSSYSGAVLLYIYYIGNSCGYKVPTCGIKIKGRLPRKNSLFDLSDVVLVLGFIPSDIISFSFSNFSYFQTTLPFLLR